MVQFYPGECSPEGFIDGVQYLLEWEIEKIKQVGEWVFGHVFHFIWSVFFR